MGEPTFHAPVARLLAVISRYPSALDWAIETTTAAWGPVALRSESFAFAETNYYEATMGAELAKTFLIFENLADPAGVGAWKHQTNAWEADFARLGQHPEPRPLNLDPGYITPAKLVLASTKDHAHRIYLGDGMFAEVTLYFKGGSWQHGNFTFPDYRRADYQQFFIEARNFLRRTATKQANQPGGKHGLP